MHKTILIYTLFFTFMLSSITSCGEGFLERYPRASIADDEALRSIRGIESTLAGLYNRMQSGQYNHREMNLVGELLADQMGIAQSNSGRLVYHPFNREGSGFGVWDQLYNDINRINMILHYIDRVTDASEERINIAKAEAFAMRAHIYFDLLRIYSRPYLHQTPLVQGEPLGVVYRTSPFLGIDEHTFQGRGTIEEGYQLVLDDFQKSLDYFTNDLSNFPYRFNYIVVKANLARVYLYMGNWEEATYYAEKVIDEAPVSLVNAQDGGEYIQRVFANAPGEESIFELGFAGGDDRPAMGTSVGGLAYFNFEEGRGYGDVILRQNLVNLLIDYDNKGDVRGKEGDADGGGTYFYETKAGQTVPFQLKYAGYRDGRHWDDIKVIRIAEMYLIAAEAYTELEEYDDARTFLNELREHRNGPDVEVNDNKEDFIDLILTERRVEFFSEMSHRWFDLRRRGMNIPKGIPGVDQGSPLNFEDYRVVDRIPPSEISVNVNIIQNPGY